MILIYFNFVDNQENETIDDIAERLKVPVQSLDPKLAKAIVIHGADLSGYDQDQIDDILR